MSNLKTLKQCQKNSPNSFFIKCASSSLEFASTDNAINESKKFRETSQPSLQNSYSLLQFNITQNFVSVTPRALQYHQ